MATYDQCMNAIEFVIKNRKFGKFKAWTLCYLDGSFVLHNGTPTQLMIHGSLATRGQLGIVISQLTEFECDAGLEIKKWNQIEREIRGLLIRGTIT